MDVKSTAVLLSGGVDSSVALHRLHSSGQHKLTAYYLKIWLEDELAYLGDCPWEEDLRYARAVTDQLGVPLHVVPMQAEYWSYVVQYAIDELKRGRTPSPDIFCNRWIKFGAFLNHCGAEHDWIASGHYAWMDRNTTNGAARLLRAKDAFKDQTYFLSQMQKSQLQRCIFPIGDMLKSEVRQYALDHSLATAQRPDSQGICFLGKIKFDDFVKFHLGEKPGKIVDRDTGKTLGVHRGYWFHTIGQRKGLGLSGGPWFVVAKDVDHNIIYVSKTENRYGKKFATGEFHATGDDLLDPNKNYQCKIRHGQNLTPCRVELLDESDHPKLNVCLEASDGGIAAGQFCVFYDGDVCMGSAAIEHALD